MEEFMWKYGLIAVEWYYWILMLVGAAVCVWAISKTKEKAYLLLVFFFVFPLVILGWNRYEAAKYSPKEYVGEVPEDAIHEIHRFVHMPVAETALVIGIFIVTKRRIREANKSLDSIGTSSAGPDRVS